MKPRLIGAIVLVALAVIFLPMLVDGPEPPSGTTEVPLDIPTPPERNFETRELPLTPPAPAANVTPAADPNDPDRVATVDVPYTPVQDAAPENTAPAAPAAPSDAAPAASSPAATPAAPVATAPAAAAPASPAPVASADGRYAVNLGSYANLDNARALVASMKAAGLAAYAEDTTSAGKPALRVRIGPFAQRAEAESARLSALRVRKDLPTGVVALDGEAAPAAAAPARPAVAAGFAVQIGALKSETDANALRDRARGAGFASYVERVSTEAGALWRVRVGPELQRANADKRKAEIKAKLQIDGNVVSHP